LVGQIVYSEKVSVMNALNKSLDLSHLEKGIYTISLENEQTSLSTKKVTIQ
jgi:cell division protein ZapA (FtsZ GTPase activity inhibitor)